MTEQATWSFRRTSSILVTCPAQCLEVTVLLMFVLAATDLPYVSRSGWGSCAFSDRASSAVAFSPGSVQNLLCYFSLTTNNTFLQEFYFCFILPRSRGRFSRQLPKSAVFHATLHRVISGIQILGQ